MSTSCRLLAACPTLASLDILASVDFFVNRLGFTAVHAEQGSWGIVERDGIQVNFWACRDKRFPENTSCRLKVQGIDVLHDEWRAQGVLHPNGPLRNTEWGTREFDVLDLHGNLITCFEVLSA